MKFLFLLPKKHAPLPIVFNWVNKKKKKKEKKKKKKAHLPQHPHHRNPHHTITPLLFFIFFFRFCTIAQKRSGSNHPISQNFCFCLPKENRKMVTILERLFLTFKINFDLNIILPKNRTFCPQIKLFDHNSIHCLLQSFLIHLIHQFPRHF